MELNSAKLIIQHSLEIGERVDLIFAQLQTKKDSDFCKDLMQHVENLTRHANALILKIELFYPDLNPDME